jgi:6-phosphogluconolactonase/glucosamine-6-phosphate isomerase/deaminase
MTKKARQSLDTTLAKTFDEIMADTFVFGDTETVESETAINPPTRKSRQAKPEMPQVSPASTPIRSALMDKLMTPEKEATVRITVDLPKSMHKSLSILAATTGKKKADIIRTLLLEVLPADEA